MKRKGLANGENHVEEVDSHEVSADECDVVFRPGDVTWIKLRGISWWPVQIADENAVSESMKPRKKSSGEILVRLYGTYDYLYMDPVSSLLEFNDVVEQHKGSHKEIIQKALEQDFADSESGKFKAKGNGGTTLKKKTKSNTRGYDATPQESARRFKIMQGLGLAAPSGSPFIKNGQTLTVVR